MKSFLLNQNTLWIHKDGRTYEVPLQELNPNRKSTPSAQSSGILKSPMPGKILKVSVKKNDTVTLGQTVCVIEAMKMEYALKAPFNGKVVDIFKQAGQLVVLDERVAELAKSPEVAKE